MNVNQSDVHPVISEHIRPQLENVFFPTTTLGLDSQMRAIFALLRAGML